MPEPLTTTVALLGVAFGGYFVGGIINNLASGEGIMRMFSGDTEEQLLQLLVAGLMVALTFRVI